MVVIITNLAFRVHSGEPTAARGMAFGFVGVVVVGMGGMATLSGDLTDFLSL